MDKDPSIEDATREHQEWCRSAIEVAQAAGELLRDRFRKPRVGVREKDDASLVSEADRAAEALILDRLRSRFPSHAFLAEESGGAELSVEAPLWVVDPLDGTTNFLRGLPIYAVSIACCLAGRPVVGVVLDPERGELFVARRGGGAERNSAPMLVSDRVGLEGAFLSTRIPVRVFARMAAGSARLGRLFGPMRSLRRCGAAALDFAYTACGVYDGLLQFRLSPWDMAAGSLLIEEGGGRVSDIDGEGRHLETGNVIAGGPAVWSRIREGLDGVVDEASLRAGALTHA